MNFHHADDNATNKNKGMALVKKWVRAAEIIAVFATIIVSELVEFIVSPRSIISLA